VLKQSRLTQGQTLNSGAPIFGIRRASFDRSQRSMNSPLLLSVIVALLTAGAAALWAMLVAADMTGLPDADATEPRDIRTW
jgi:hypothetical protein